MTGRPITHHLARLYAAGLLVPAIYLVAGAIIYGPVLNVFFMSDDFEFLAIVAPARSVSVILEPLVGRFVRPLVVLMYYANYHVFGLAPWAYHVSTLLPHFVSSWLVFRVALRLGGQGTDLWAFLAGLLFLVFAGHSEAVAWPAGIADPILTVCLLTGFLCYLRALEARASRLWLMGMFVAVVAGSLAKEVWVVFPGLISAHILTFGVLRDRTGRRHALIAVAGTTALVGMYLIVRHSVFGSVAGGYAGLGSSLQTGLFAEQTRAFVLRSFLPASAHLAGGMLRRAEGILAVAAVLLLVWSARGRAVRVLIFSVMAGFVALLPVLPLTISISTTEGERYVYLPTAFCCIFMVWALKTVARHRVVAVLACTLAIGLHATALVRANMRWKVSGALTRSIIDSYAEMVLQGNPHGEVFVLNLPDNVTGAYVFRNGFLPAIRLVRPDLAARTGRTLVVATQSVGAFDDSARVTPSGEGRFTLELGSNRLLQPEVPSSVHYRVGAQRPDSYAVQFGASVRSGLILYMTQGRLAVAGTIEGPGLPFGHVDLPAGDAMCAGESIRFAGWALDDEGVARVIGQDDEAAGASDGSAVPGEAAWTAPGARPDVARAFSGYPGAERAGWALQVSCASAASSPARRMRVRVVAYDKAGHEAIIGERVLHAPR